jgi:hypothetical protein
MEEIILLTTYFPIFIACTCFYTGVLVLLRLPRLDDRLEGIYFLMIAFTACAWSLKPLFKEILWYEWITAILISNAAVLYVSHLSSGKLKSALRVYVFLSISYFTVLLISGLVYSPSFPVYFAAGVFPGLVAIK